MNSYLSNFTIPAWYELSLINHCTLGLKIHRTALAKIQEIKWDGAPGVQLIFDKFKLRNFTPPKEGSCGFEGVFTPGKSEHTEWVAWECKLPRIKKIGDEESSFQDVMAIRSTLWLFSTALCLFEGDTGWRKPQLMVIEGICLPTDEDRMATGALSVTLMPPVMPWLVKHEDQAHIEPIVKAMREANDYMWPSSNCHGRFGALFRKPKWLNLDVPGDACGLDPGNYYDESLERGYTLQPHNVDSSLQQLTFLAGLGRLHDLVRSESV